MCCPYTDGLAVFSLIGDHPHLFGSSVPPCLRGPVHQLTAPPPSARSAPRDWPHCCRPGPAWTAGSGSSCWSTCRPDPRAPEPRSSTPSGPPPVAVDTETQTEEMLARDRGRNVNAKNSATDTRTSGLQQTVHSNKKDEVLSPVGTA